MKTLFVFEEPHYPVSQNLNHPILAVVSQQHLQQALAVKTGHDPLFSSDPRSAAKTTTPSNWKHPNQPCHIENLSRTTPASVGW